MVIKITRKTKHKNPIYKSSKTILTTQDIKDADEFDKRLVMKIKEIENILIEHNALSVKNKKKDPLQVWHLIGGQINQFLKTNHIEKEDEHIFWDSLYGRSSIVHSGNPSSKISHTRNDFKTSTILAKYPLEMLRKVGSWALWREILVYKILLTDERIFKWVINELIKHPRTRDAARPFLKSIAARFKKIDTSVLSNNELLRKLEEI